MDPEDLVKTVSLQTSELVHSLVIGFAAHSWRLEILSGVCKIIRGLMAKGIMNCILPTRFLLDLSKGASAFLHPECVCVCVFVCVCVCVHVHVCVCVYMCMCVGRK